MAIYHLTAKVIKRSKGQSAVASAAYRHAEKFYDLREAKTHDYRNKGNVVASLLLAPEGAPAWATQREALWNLVENTEKRKDSQLASEVEVALPRELSPAARLELVTGFAQTQFIAKGMIADIAIHCPKASDGKDAPHAHIMLTMRPIENELFGNKNRDWNPEFRNNKGNKGFVTTSDLLKNMRENWAIAVNDALADASSNARIDHRSYADQGILKEPQPKLGFAKLMADKYGEIKDQYAELMEVRHRNRMREHLARNQNPHNRKAVETITRTVQIAKSLAQRGIEQAGERLQYLGRLQPSEGIDHER